MATQVHDDGFHEIQLNGKQLVFLFMAATVVSVVIFLCGVLVGRGVRAERGTADAGLVAETMPQPPAAAPAPAATTSAGSDPTTAAPPPAAQNDELSYFNRLEKLNQPAERLKAGSAKPAPPPERPAPAAPASAATSGSAASAPAPPAADPNAQGYTVQVTALNVRGEAEAIARRLSAKGYAAYMLAPADGTPAVYRVRVGKFSTRREADAIAARLKREEQFNPWVTR